MTDDDTEPALMTAGRFAERTLLSAKALRVYADRGLLRPYRTDPENGYRWYAPGQVETGWTIALLRSAGLSLEVIGGIVDATDRGGALAAFDRAAADRRRASSSVDAVLDRARLRLGQGLTVSTVTTDFIDDRAVLSVLRRMSQPQMEAEISSALATLAELAERAGLQRTGDPFGIYHAPVTEDSHGPLEIVLPVDRLTDAVEDPAVRSYRLGGGPVATRTAEGAENEFPQVLALYDEVHSWITSAGRVPVGPPREVWHTPWTDPKALRVTIVWPYAPAPDPA